MLRLMNKKDSGLFGGPESETETETGSDLSILLVNISYYSNDGKNIFLVFEWQGVTPRFFVCPWDANIDAKIYVCKGSSTLY